MDTDFYLFTLFKRARSRHEERHFISALNLKNEVWECAFIKLRNAFDEDGTLFAVSSRDMVNDVNALANESIGFVVAEQMVRPFHVVEIEKKKSSREKSLDIMPPHDIEESIETATVENAKLTDRVALAELIDPIIIGKSKGKNVV